jgi:cyclohexadienyl dehydratase
VRIAVNAGGENEGFDRANLKKANLVVIPSYGELYQTLLNGKAHVVISDMVEETLGSKSNGTLCVATPGKPFNCVGNGHQMSREVVWKSLVDTWLHIQVISGP